MLRRVLRIVLIVVAVLVAGVGGFALYVSVSGIPKYTPEHVELTIKATPERLARGRKLASLLCADCHLNQSTGAFTGRFMVEAPKEFGVVYSANITKHPTKGVGSWTDGEIAYFLRTGVKRDGQYVPPYMPKLPQLSDEDMASVLTFVRSDDPWVQAKDVDSKPVQPSFLNKMLTHLVIKPLPYPHQPIAPPDPNSEVEVGKYYATVLQCYQCHSADFTTVDAMTPEKSVGYFGGGNKLTDATGAPVLTANITPDDETGIGKWSREDFVHAVKAGFAPGTRVLRAPMQPYPELTDAEAGAIYAYLRTIPKLHHAVPRAVAPAEVAGASGSAVYHKYGCFGCHGETGIGTCDLRGAAAKYPNNDALISFIRKPVSVVPDSRMPTWDGVIDEREYAPLADYVRQLANATAQR